MPHHPCRGCEVEHAVPWPDVAVQDVLLFVLDEGPGYRMDDALWFSGGARAVEDISWVLGWESFEFGIF